MAQPETAFSILFHQPDNRQDWIRAQLVLTDDRGVEVHRLETPEPGTAWAIDRISACNRGSNGTTIQVSVGNPQFPGETGLHLIYAVSALAQDSIDRLSLDRVPEVVMPGEGIWVRTITDSTETWGVRLSGRITRNVR